MSSRPASCYLFHYIADNELLNGCGELVTVETRIQRFYDLLTSIWLAGNSPFYHKTCKNKTTGLHKTYKKS